MRCRLFCVLIITWYCSDGCLRSASAQTATLTPGNNTFNYTTISSLSTAVTQTFTDQLAITVPLLSLLSSVQVRATGDLTSTGGQTIPLSNFKVQITAARSSLLGTLLLSTAPQVTLTTANQQLASGLSLGGTLDFTLSTTFSGTIPATTPPGTYTTSVIYSLPTTLGGTPTVTGTIVAVISPLAGIVLQNGGNNATLSFTTAANYQNGVTLVQTNALVAFSNEAYSVNVSGSANLFNGTNFITLGNILISPVPNPANGSIITQEVPLSLSPQNILTAAPAGTQNYNLQYRTTAGNTAFLNKPAGNYTTTITYTITNP